MKVFWGIVAIVVGLLLLAWVLTGFNLEWNKYWLPRFSNVQRQVFENTKSYNEGMEQELENMRQQYVTADSAHKELLASIIIHRSANYDLSNLRDDSLRTFIQHLRENQNEQAFGK